MTYVLYSVFNVRKVKKKAEQMTGMKCTNLVICVKNKQWVKITRALNGALSDDYQIIIPSTISLLNYWVAWTLRGRKSVRKNIHLQLIKAMMNTKNGPEASTPQKGTKI